MIRDTLKGKIALITGAAGGIGRATADLFAQHGVNSLYLIDMDTEALADAEHALAHFGCPIHTIAADLSTPEGCQQAIAKAYSYGEDISVVLSNAGIARQCSFLNTTRELWEREIAINLSSHFFVCQTAAKELVKKQRGGTILCTVSTAAYGGMPMAASYGAAKSGLLNLVKTMALELAPYGIRVNSVSPGATDTRLAAAQVDNETFERMRKSFPVPLGRLALPKEIADGFLYLASDASTFITGFDLVIDGGSIQYAMCIGQIASS